MNLQIKPVPLPATVEELEALKTMKTGNINDDIDRIHKAVWPNPDYRRFHEGVFDEDTVEGSKTADDFEAATMIRDYAKDHDEYRYIAKKNKATIVRHMHVVLRRYHMTRKERAMTVAGEIVPNNGNVGE